MPALKPFLTSSFKILKKDLRIVFWRTGRALYLGKYPAIGFLLGIVLISIFFVHPYDESAIQYIKETKTPAIEKTAKRLGWWGDFIPFNLVGFLLIWSFGTIFKKRWFQRLAVVTIYTALIAGLSVNVLRLTTGRPRPYANLDDKFHGVSGVLRGWEYHGFPSGHTSTAMGFGVPIATATGVYGLPILVFSASVGASRVYRLKHYPTDVLVGGAFGVIYGCASGWHLRKIRRRLRKRRQPQD